MYYVNQEQIDLRLAFIPVLIQACEELQAASNGKEHSLLLSFAQERTLHLAIETVTDVGSLLIDAFMMRDASSYEDIVEILAGEGVFDQDVERTLKPLVQLRRLLAQDYTEFPRTGMHEMIQRLPDALRKFAEAVPSFIQKESL